MDGREPLINRRPSSIETAGHAQEAPLLGSHPVVLAVDGQGGADAVDLGWRGAAAELKDGMGYMLPAARTRANATYYGFICLSLGIIVMILILLNESRQWRQTVKTEGELWRDIVREVVHDIGFI